MFSTFKTDSDRDLIVRVADLRRIEDTTDGCTLALAEEGQGVICYRISGTASENFERIKQEELERIAQAELMQQRQRQGYPAIPVQRGRP